MSKTYAAKPSEITRKWWLVDAQDLIVGRASAIIANILRGKDKPYYSPNLDCGDYVIIVNADKVKFTGKKHQEKRYYYHTGYPGGIRERSPRQLLEGKTPEKVLRLAISRMMSKGPLQRDVLSKLYVYAGDNHPHQAQNPEKLDIGAMNRKNKKTN